MTTLGSSPRSATNQENGRKYLESKMVVERSDVFGPSWKLKIKIINVKLFLARPSSVQSSEKLKSSENLRDKSSRREYYRVSEDILYHISRKDLMIMIALASRNLPPFVGKSNCSRLKPGHVLKN